jgi:predicted dehydrogenase
MPRPKAWQGAPDFVKPEDRDFYAGDVGNMCHDVNLIRFLIGEPRRIRAAVLKDKKPYWPRRIVVFDCGDFDCTWETGYVQTPFFDEGALIRFDKGWIRVGVHAPLRIGAPADVEIFRNGRLERPQPGWAWSFQREADHFIECVLNNKESRSSGRDSAKDIALMEEIYKASTA